MRLTIRQATHASLYLMVSKGMFVLAAMALNMFLARYLGPRLYGQYGVVMAFLVWLESAANPGLSIAVQKLLADHPEATRHILARTLRLQWAYSAMLLLLSLLLAPLIARLLHDVALFPLLMLASVDMVFCSRFTVYYSTLNGLLHFRAHALCTLSYAIAKCLLVALLVVNGASLAGAFVGNALASVAGILVSRLLLRTLSVAEKTPKSSVTSDLIRLGAPVTLFAFLTQLLLHLDLFFVKRLLWQQPTMVGCYVLAASLARAFHALMQSLPASLFPFLAHARAIGDPGLIAVHLRAMTKRLMLLILVVALLARFLAKPLIILLFSDTYLSVVRMLPWLMVGMGLMSGFSLFANALQAWGDLRTPVWVALGCLVAASVAHLLWIPRWGAMGAASGVVLSGFLGSMMMMMMMKMRLRSSGVEEGRG